MNKDNLSIVNQKNVLNKKLDVYGNVDNSILTWKRDANLPLHSFQTVEVFSHDAKIGNELQDSVITFQIPKNGILSYMLVELELNANHIEEETPFFNCLENIQIIHEPHNKILYEAPPGVLINDAFENDYSFYDLLNNLMKYKDSTIHLPIVIPQFNDLIQNSINQLQVLGNLSLRLNFKKNRDITNPVTLLGTRCLMDFMYPHDLASTMTKQIRYMNRNVSETSKRYVIAEGDGVQDITERVVLRNRGFCKRIIINMYDKNDGETVVPNTIKNLQVLVRNTPVYRFKDTYNDVAHFFSRSHLLKHNLVNYTQHEANKPLCIDFGINQTHHNSRGSGLSMNIDTTEMQWNKDGEVELDYTFSINQIVGGQTVVLEIVEEMACVQTLHENGEWSVSDYDHDPREEDTKQKVGTSDDSNIDDVVADQKEKATEKTSGTKTTKGSQQQNITIKKKSTPDVKAPQMIREETDKAVEETKNRDTQKENIHKATGLAD